MNSRVAASASGVDRRSVDGHATSRRAEIDLASLTRGTQGFTSDPRLRPGVDLRPHVQRR